MASIGDVLNGRYRLIRLRGQGGMSDVYEATDERRGVAVAVKVVRSDDPDLARRLQQEVRALGRVEHPGLVRLLDTGVVEDHAYLVMELVDGSTLAQLLRAGPLGAERTAQIGAALADGLAYAHGQGIVHRDVKPSNILMGSDGNARLGDFGIARLLDGSTLTVTGTTLGTAAYMAPEQIEDHQVGAAADVWSLGMVLLECLTGHRVYEGSPAEIVGRRRSGPVPVEPGLPVPWKLLLGGMLERRPDQRLDSAQVATLLATSPFREPWEGSAIHRLDPTAAMATATPTAIPDPSPLTSRGIPTVILPPAQPGDWPPVQPGDGRRRTRYWWVGVLGLVVVAAIAIGLALASGTGPTGHHPPTTTVTTRVTTTIPTTTVSTTTTTTTIAPTTTIATAPATAPPAPGPTPGKGPGHGHGHGHGQDQ